MRPLPLPCFSTRPVYAKVDYLRIAFPRKMSLGTPGGVGPYDVFSGTICLLNLQKPATGAGPAAGFEINIDRISHLHFVFQKAETCEDNLTGRGRDSPPFAGRLPTAWNAGGRARSLIARRRYPQHDSPRSCPRRYPVLSVRRATSGRSFPRSSGAR